MLSINQAISSDSLPNSLYIQIPQSPKVKLKKLFHYTKNTGSRSVKHLYSSPLPSFNPSKTFSDFYPETGFTHLDVVSIYRSKCQDLKICTSKDQEQKFVTNFLSSVKGKKIDLQGTGLGSCSATILASVLRGAKKYSHLILSNNNLGDEGCEKIAKMLRRNLNFIHVDFSGNNLTPEGSARVFEKFINNQSVISLNISSIDRMNKNRIGMQGSQVLSGLLYRTRTLNFLDVSGTGVGKEGIEYISTGLSFNTSLLSLNLSFNNLEGKHLLPFFTSLAKTPLKELVLSGNPLGFKGSEHLSALLAGDIKGGCHLTKLEMSKTEIDEESCEKIFQALEKNTSINELNISYNPFGAKPCFSISKALMHNSFLKSLNLRSCNIQEEGLVRLTEGISRNFTLKSLNLSKNYLCDEGVKALSESLRKNSGLVSLDLSSNLIKNSGGSALIEGLYQNVSINSINLNNNSLKDEFGHELLALLGRCKNLMSVFLEFNSVNLKYVNLIQKCLERNKKRHLNTLSPKIQSEIEKLLISEEHIEGVFREINLKEKEKHEVNQKFFKQRTKFFEAKNEEIEKFESLKIEKDTIMSRKQTLVREGDATYFDISKTKFLKEKEIKELKEATANLGRSLVLIKKQKSYLSDTVQQKNSKFAAYVSDLKYALQKVEFQRNSARDTLEELKGALQGLKEELNQRTTSSYEISPKETIVSQLTRKKTLLNSKTKKFKNN